MDNLSQPQPGNQLAHRINNVSKITGASRTTIYAALKAGELQAVKLGKSTLVLDTSVRHWLANLPKYAA